MIEIDKDLLIKYYIEDNLSTAECASIFHCSAGTIQAFIKKNNIVKSSELKWESRNKKSEKTNLVKYGVTNPSKLDSIKQARRERSLKKYGVEYPSQRAETQEKRKKTNLERYGVEVPTKNEKVKEKQAQTNLERYGVKAVSQSKEIRDKQNATCIQKYGYTSSLQNEEVNKKARATMKKLYGVEYSGQSSELRSKRQKTSLTKYGTFNANQQDIKHLDVWINPDLFKNYLEENSKPTIYEISQYFNVCVSAALKKTHQYKLESLVDINPFKSHYESEIESVIRDKFNINNIQHNVKTLLKGRQEVDLYLPDYKLGIEFNGNYWHSDAQEKYQDHNGRTTKHQQKSLEAESKGLFLFHIFEYEWNNSTIRQNIINRLSSLLNQNTRKIAARKCQIRELTKDQKKAFLNANHIQGNDRSTIALGLFLKEELVACMSFVKPKTKYSWELSRFCTTHQTTVQGGASKLFRYFINNILKKDEVVVSYNDISKTKGDIYPKLGFELKSINDPNYIWMNFQTLDIRTRYQEQAAGEVERMHNLGYHRICDCGTKTWIFKKESV